MVDARQGALNETALMGAAAWGATSCVRLLLEKGADARLVDENGATALHRAASAGNAEVAEAVLRFAGTAILSGVNVCNKAGYTPADVARREGHAALEGLLQKMMDLANTESNQDSRVL